MKSLSTRFVLISRWRLACPTHMAWQLITDLESWPQWWPQVKRVRVLHQAPVGQTGTHMALTWRSMLGYGFTIDVLNTRRERHADGHCEIEGRSAGDLLGRGLWVLDPVSAREVDVTYRYEIELNKPWMRALAPLLRAVFTWNHFAVMRAGARGMAARLNCRTPAVDNWTAGPSWA